MPVGCFHDFVPDGAIDGFIVEVRAWGNDSVDLGDQIREHLDFLALSGQFPIALSGLGVGDQRVALKKLRKDAHELAVLRDH